MFWKVLFWQENEHRVVPTNLLRFSHLFWKSCWPKNQDTPKGNTNTGALLMMPTFCCFSSYQPSPEKTSLLPGSFGVSSTTWPQMMGTKPWFRAPESGVNAPKVIFLGLPRFPILMQALLISNISLLPMGSPRYVKHVISTQLLVLQECLPVLLFFRA